MTAGPLFLCRRTANAACLLALISIAAASTPASSSEVITYRYDARGRLVQVARSGTVNDGITANYSYDDADNRTNVTVTAGGVVPPSFAVSDGSATEGGMLVFTITKSGAAATAYSVKYSTSNGTASSGADYDADAQTLTFGVSETSKTVVITTFDDADIEGTETFYLNLSNPTGGAAMTDAQGIGTINDNDSIALPSFSINNTSAYEGNSLVFTVTKSGVTTGTFSVSYATSNGTAQTVDYTAKSGTLTFGPSEATKTISVPTTEETYYEENETVLVNLSGATGGSTIGDGQGVGTIVNDDSGSACPTCGSSNSLPPSEDPPQAELPVEE